ncbi:MAG: CDP-alcohol phosphatidyltransferase family protein [Myxococcales bacterium]|nr:CDP-alcohol phosphatidyltransferase family protein [Myxococcales bacterium]
MAVSSAKTAPAAWIFRPADAPAIEIWSLTPEERLRRALRNAGCARVECVDPEGSASPPDSGTVLVFRSDAIYDERLVQALVSTPDTVLVAPRRPDGGFGGPVAAHVEAAQLRDAVSLLRHPSEPPAASLRALRRVSPGELAPDYTASLRKSDPAYLVPARAEEVRAIEERIFAASYKGITDLVTKWVWPRPAAAVTRVLARHRVRPNTITIASWVLAIGATLAFAKGAFGLGLVAAWLMTFLDTVDGKLARVTLTSSRVGDVLDHGLDLVHPPFWYFAWGLGLPAGFEAATAVVVGGYFVGRLLEGIFLYIFAIEIHCWRPIDSQFRTITARRNPNLILLSAGTLGGRPDLGLVMVALWTVASIGFHVVRLIQALVLRRRGRSIEPWAQAGRRQCVDPV